MPILLISFALWGTVFAGLWSGALTDLSLFLQSHCIELFSRNSPHQSLYQALVCGNRLSPQDSFRQNVAQLGLIHLLVVSGAHLIWVEFAARKFFAVFASRKLHSPLSLIFVFLFALSCGLQAPVLRSAFSLSLRLLNQRLGLNWLPSQRVALSALLCLPLLSQGLDSISLQLSWGAALALSVPIHSQAKYRNFKKATLVYIFLSPLLLPLVSLPHPASILLNGVIAGALLSFWLGLSFLQLLSFFPGIGLLSDSLMGLSLSLLTNLTQIWPETWSACALLESFSGLCSRGWSWAYLAALQSLILVYELHHRQQPITALKLSLSTPSGGAQP